MLEEISVRIRENFEAKDRIREEGLKISREIVRECRKASFALHGQDFEKADKNIKIAGKALEKLEILFEGHADIYHAGFVEHAQQEYSEVAVLSSLLKEEGDRFPFPEELRVEYAAYLNGLGDVVGELRRHVLDFDYPDAITRGLRRKTDVSRSIIEKTRGDVVNAIGQKKLEIAMRNLESRL